MTTQRQTLRHRIQQLPPLPTAITRLLDMLEDDTLSSDLKQVEQQVLTDPVLAGRILQIANSSFYGLRQQVVSISQACAILGTHTLKNLVYTMAIMQRLSQPHDNSVIDYAGVWRHSLLTACLTASVAEGSRLNSLCAFTTGLFHNIGLLIMDLIHPGLLQQQMDKARNNGWPLERATAQLGSAAHQHVAIATLETWNIPESIIAPFRQPDASSTNTTPGVDALNWVRCCAIMANSMGTPYLEGIPLPVPEQGHDDCMEKDLSSLLPAMYQGYATYEGLRANLL